MIVVAQYSHKNGLSFIRRRHPNEYREILDVIDAVKACALPKKVSKEKGMEGRLLHSPEALNKAFENEFRRRGWEKRRIRLSVNIQQTGQTYEADREMDYVKNGVGVEVQFGKYSFMVYNICAKMTIFSNHKVIDCGVEIVPMKSMADNMSSGVSYYEMVVADLTHRGVADIDIPVLVIGIDAECPSGQL
ncbi:MAG: restriction endonuclease [Thermoprotei archaeon]|nr:MAG: restriction endonuclease [Thermoprotei archaeon]